MRDSVIISGSAAYGKNLNQIFARLSAMNLQPVRAKSFKKMWMISYV